MRIGTKLGLFALVGITLAAAPALALTGDKGAADRITIRDGYSQYAGKVDLRASSDSTVTYHYWGGDRCVGATQPSVRQINRLLDAHNAGREITLDYQDNVTATYGTSECWDGGIQIW